MRYKRAECNRPSCHKPADVVQGENAWCAAHSYVPCSCGRFMPARRAFAGLECESCVTERAYAPDFTCPRCASESVGPLGVLGRIVYARCQDCHCEFGADIAGEVSEV
jgi:hypothetical protein